MGKLILILINIHAIVFSNHHKPVSDNGSIKSSENDGSFLKYVENMLWGYCYEVKLTIDECFNPINNFQI